MSPTQLTLRDLKKNDYLAQVVERWNPFAHVRVDLFGIIDIVAVHPERPGVLGIQATSYDNISARVKKLEASPNTEIWLSAGNKLQVWGWRKVKNRWTNKVLTILPQ